MASACVCLCVCGGALCMSPNVPNNWWTCVKSCNNINNNPNETMFIDFQRWDVKVVTFAQLDNNFQSAVLCLENIHIVIASLSLLLAAKMQCNNKRALNIMWLACISLGNFPPMRFIRTKSTNLWFCKWRIRVTMFNILPQPHFLFSTFFWIFSLLCEIKHEENLTKKKTNHE